MHYKKFWTKLVADFVVCFKDFSSTYFCVTALKSAKENGKYKTTQKYTSIIKFNVSAPLGWYIIIEMLTSYSELNWMIDTLNVQGLASNSQFNRQTFIASIWSNDRLATEYKKLIGIFLKFLMQSGKLKGMMPTIIGIGERLRSKISNAVNENKSIEIKDLAIRFIECANMVLRSIVSKRAWFLTRFALDVVGTVAFGLDVNTLENPDDPFRDLEKLVNNGEIINRIRLVGAFMCPR